MVFLEEREKNPLVFLFLLLFCKDLFAFLLSLPRVFVDCITTKRG